MLLLGGAFQSFRSFAAEVDELLVDHPLILLDLPSQGGNLQLAPELGRAHGCWRGAWGCSTRGVSANAPRAR